MQDVEELLSWSTPDSIFFVFFIFRKYKLIFNIQPVYFIFWFQIKPIFEAMNV